MLGDVDGSLLFTRETRVVEARRVAGGTAVAVSRANPLGEGKNEDAVALLSDGAGGGVLVVADGAGGMPAGAHAAGLAVRSMAAAVEQAVRSERPLRDGILDGFERSNSAILELGVGAGTTLAAVELENGRLRPYHTGDSAIVVTGQRGKVKLITVSHSPVGYGVEAGLIDAREALAHDQLHIVSNMVGSVGMRIELGATLRLARHDTVVVGTDGLFDNVHLSEVTENVSTGPLEEAARRLLTLCEERMRCTNAGTPSKPDDVSFILFRAGS